MSNSPDPHPESPATELERLKLETARAELNKTKAEVEKTSLEIKNLKSRLNRNMPVITAIISILGFFSGIYFFIHQQENDRLSRDQSRYSTSSQELLGFPHQSIGVARALALRRDIDELIDSLYPSDLRRRQIKDELTRSIHNLFSQDCDFTQPRQVQLDIAALEYWDDYRKGCEGAFNLSMADKYISAFAELHRRDSDVFKKMKFIDSDDYPDPESVVGEPYMSLFRGYMCHYRLLTDEEQKTKLQKRVGRVTESDTLAGDIESSIKCPARLAVTKVPQAAPADSTQPSN